MDADTFLVLADMSGYTRFVAGSTMAHSEMWVRQLLEQLMSRLVGPLDLAAVEGDALFLHKATAHVDGPALLGLLTAAHRDFRRTAQLIDPCTGCDCAACDSGKDMTVKFLVHRGPAHSSIVGGSLNLFGSEVIVVHRLLKNSIPAKEYIFVSDDALTVMPLGARAIPHTESTDVRAVPGRYLLLTDDSPPAARIAFGLSSPPD